MNKKKTYYAPMHTAEHILNKVMIEMFGCERSENCHIERKKSKCDFVILQTPTENKMKAVENRVKEIISQCLDVTHTFVDYDIAILEHKIRVNKEENPRIRITQIGDFDACPCIGEHVENTSEIESFEISSYTWENNKLRIRFKAK